MVLGRRVELLRHRGGQPTDRGAGRPEYAGRPVVPRRHDQLRHRGIPARHRRAPRPDSRRRGRLHRVVVGPAAVRDRRVHGLLAGPRCAVRRRRRRLPAQRRRGRRRGAGRGERGRHLGGVQSGCVRRRRDRQVGPGGARRSDRHGRLAICRQAHRSAHRAGRDPRGDADPAGHGGGAAAGTGPRRRRRRPSGASGFVGDSGGNRRPAGDLAACRSGTRCG